LTAYWHYIVYVLFGAAALSVYLLLPRIGRSMRPAGALFGLVSLAGVLGLCTSVLVPSGANIFFYLSATVAIVSGVKVITHDEPVYSALYFVLVVLAITPLLILQGAEFLAIAMVIIYAGAILVTYVFVIMLSQQSNPPVYDRRAREPFVAVVCGFVTMAILAGQIPSLLIGTNVSEATTTAASATAAKLGNTEQIGMVLLSEYVVAFEVAGVLLLVAMIGAIAMSVKNVPHDDPVPAGPPPGTIGREVPPF